MADLNPLSIRVLLGANRKEVRRHLGKPSSTGQGVDRWRALDAEVTYWSGGVAGELALALANVAAAPELAARVLADFRERLEPQGLVVSLDEPGAGAKLRIRSAGFHAWCGIRRRRGWAQEFAASLRNGSAAVRARAIGPDNTTLQLHALMLEEDLRELLAGPAEAAAIVEAGFRRVECRGQDWVATATVDRTGLRWTELGRQR